MASWMLPSSGGSSFDAQKASYFNSHVAFYQRNFDKQVRNTSHGVPQQGVVQKSQETVPLSSMVTIAQTRPQQQQQNHQQPLPALNSPPPLLYFDHQDNDESRPSQGSTKSPPILAADLHVDTTSLPKNETHVTSSDLVDKNVSTIGTNASKIPSPFALTTPLLSSIPGKHAMKSSTAMFVSSGIFEVVHPSTSMKTASSPKTCHLLPEKSTTAIDSSTLNPPTSNSLSVNPSGVNQSGPNLSSANPSYATSMPLFFSGRNPNIVVSAASPSWVSRVGLPNNSRAATNLENDKTGDSASGTTEI
jgi:hypothetical protein